jgi:DNA-binding IscR family transcriptional regulator
VNQPSYQTVVTFYKILARMSRSDGGKLNVTVLKDRQRHNETHLIDAVNDLRDCGMIETHMDPGTGVLLAQWTSKGIIWACGYDLPEYRAYLGLR